MGGLTLPCDTNGDTSAASQQGKDGGVTKKIPGYFWHTG